jgi:hypothetical protein
MAIPISIAFIIWSATKPCFIYFKQQAFVYACVIYVALGYTNHANAQQTMDAATKRAFDGLLLGMSMETVKEQVGNPTRIEPFKLIHIQSGDTTLCWYYGINGWTLLFKNRYLDKIERNRDQLLNKVQSWSDPRNPDGIKIYYGK